MRTSTSTDGEGGEGGGGSEAAAAAETRREPAANEGKGRTRDSGRRNRFAPNFPVAALQLGNARRCRAAAAAEKSIAAMPLTAARARSERRVVEKARRRIGFVLSLLDCRRDFFRFRRCAKASQAFTFSGGKKKHDGKRTKEALKASSPPSLP